MEQRKRRHLHAGGERHHRKLYRRPNLRTDRSTYLARLLLFGLRQHQLLQHHGRRADHHRDYARSQLQLERRWIRISAHRARRQHLYHDGEHTRRVYGRFDGHIESAHTAYHLHQLYGKLLSRSGRRNHQFHRLRWRPWADLPDERFGHHARTPVRIGGRHLLLVRGRRKGLFRDQQRNDITRPQLARLHPFRLHQPHMFLQFRRNHHP